MVTRSRVVALALNRGKSSFTLSMSLMSEQTNHIAPFEYGRYSVEAWGHRSSTGVGGMEMIWSIRVDEAILGSFSAPVDLGEAEVAKRVKHWVSQNLPK